MIGETVPEDLNPANEDDQRTTPETDEEHDLKCAKEQRNKSIAHDRG